MANKTVPKNLFCEMVHGVPVKNLLPHLINDCRTKRCGRFSKYNHPIDSSIIQADPEVLMNTYRVSFFIFGGILEVIYF